MMDESQAQCKKLIDAAHNGDLKTIREIVANGFDLSTPNNLGESILSAAIFELSIIDSRHDSLERFQRF